MLVLRCSSKEKSMDKLLKMAQKVPYALLFLKPAAAKTKAELEFAFFLARGTIKSRKSISAKLANEAMLFLSGETNFSSAVRKIGAKKTSDFVLVAERDLKLAKLKKALNLKKAKAHKLSAWGKKRKNYSQGELAIEKMAISRIKK